MPSVTVDLDSETHAWLAERARKHDRPIPAELEALLTAVRIAPDNRTPLPVGVYTDEPPYAERIEREGSTGEDPDLPVGVFDESTETEDASERKAT